MPGNVKQIAAAEADQLEALIDQARDQVFDAWVGNPRRGVVAADRVARIAHLYATKDCPPEKVAALIELLGEDAALGHLGARVKALAASGAGVRYKQAPGVTSVELPTALAAALNAARAAAGDEQLVQLLSQAAGQQPRGGSPVSDSDPTVEMTRKPATKAAKPKLTMEQAITNALDQVAREGFFTP